jgi:hypothetical protein
MNISTCIDLVLCADVGRSCATLSVMGAPSDHLRELFLFSIVVLTILPFGACRPAGRARNVLSRKHGNRSASLEPTLRAA